MCKTIIILGIHEDFIFELRTIKPVKNIDDKTQNKKVKNTYYIITNIVYEHGGFKFWTWHGGNLKFMISWEKKKKNNWSMHTKETRPLYLFNIIIDRFHKFQFMAEKKGERGFIQDVL